MESDIYKKEYSLTEIISAALALFRDNAATILALTLLISVPVTLINIAASGIFSIDWMSDPSITPEEFSTLLSESMGDVIMSLLTLGAISVMLSFVSLLSSMALAFYVKSCLDGKKIDFSTAYSRAFGRWPSAIWTSIIQAIILIFLFLLLIIPGVIYSVYWSFALYAVALGGKSGKEALSYSKKIVQNRWWTVLGYAIVFGIIGFILTIPIVIALGFFRWALTDPASSIALDAASGILFSLAGSLTVVMQIIFYLNCESNIKSAKKEY
ncbi:MAG: hypothetical protein WAX07_06520 [Candidatus Altiarchaeia archaeon]